MTLLRRFPVALEFILALGVACASYGSDFGPRRIDPVAPGYEVSVTTVTPAPGTWLQAGQVVTFAVTASYRLDETDSGQVFLAPQDDQGRRLHPGRPQSAVAVRRGSGVVTLTDSITVPGGIREVQLFTLLAPAGALRVYGEVVVRFPVRPKR